jgi:alanine-alpha-ketoisovalerate/valine-pyruvate aminotransferase
MIISQSEREIRPIEIDLSGPQGNAFVLLGLAKRLAKQMGLDAEDIKTQMTSGDYENLIQVFDDNFGDQVTLIR